MKRLVLPTVAMAMLVFAAAGPAVAHVTVIAPGATRGGSDEEITFQVPVEKDVDTVGLTVALPLDTPIASVLVEPVAGWRHSQKTAQLARPIKTDDGEITTAVSQISWRATAGHGLGPGEFGRFTIMAGQLPDVASLTFKALQYYSDGSVTRWIEVAAPGSTAEPVNPAPVLDLAAATSATPASTSNSSSNTGPYALSILAIVCGAAALGVALLGRLRKKR